jgi:indolepyruvate ferredoxin oxidoreductase beta subunit
MTATTNQSLPERPLTILVAALGGEGGGVLADWIIAAATAQDYPVQSTSIPGVAQRTGATTYYVELYPARISELAGRLPVMTLTPAPGYVDVMVASELLEAGRAMINGFVTADRTTLIASNHRIYTTMEKMQMGDGRFDSDKIVKAAGELAKRAILFDMAGIAAKSGTVISAVMFGALAGSGALPLPRAACEDAIRKMGKGAEASLRGFAAGFEHAASGTRQGHPLETPAWRGFPADRVRAAFPAATHKMLEEGVARCTDFQDKAYADLYLDRLEPVLRLDGDDYTLTSETGRFLALWMCYEDVIRVADLKSRKSRFERVRKEVQAGPDEPLHIIEYLKPGVEEVAALLPGPMSRAFLSFAKRHGLTHKLNVGLYVKTTSVFGFLLLRSLAWLRPLRRMTARYGEEQALITRWLAAICASAARDTARNHALALEIALCGRLIKGYGDTHRRGKDNFLRILDTVVVDNTVNGANFADDQARAEAIRKAREAALADPEGRALENTLATHGITPLPPKAKTIQFMKRPAANKAS